MSVLAKTEAAGGGSLHPEVLRFSSSLRDDRALLREDLVGSLAHVVMLGRTGIVAADEARTLKAELERMWQDAAAGALPLPDDEEDVHMAIEALLGQRVGAVAKKVHSARSRNDQVATALHLFVRERCRQAQAALLSLLEHLVARAEADRELLIPSYTHRQRAQLVSVAHYFLAWAEMVRRDVEAFEFAYGQANLSPLGAGAIAGSTLPIDRQLTARLMQFARPTANAMDTVGDRDFVADYLYAGTRFLLHASRLSADMVDFATSEFGFVELSNDVSCGSSMMPQKKNPDVFELVRGKAGPQLGALVSLLTLTKGLPSGYNRDLQEDRRPLLEAAERLERVTSVLAVALPAVRFRPENCLRAAQDSSMLATDLAEALVKRGVPFRSAYGAIGKLVAWAAREGKQLGEVPAAQALALDPMLDAEALSAARPEGALQRKQSEGGSGLVSVDAQIASLRSWLQDARASLARKPSLEQVFAALQEQVV